MVQRRELRVNFGQGRVQMGFAADHQWQVTDKADQEDEEEDAGSVMQSIFSGENKPNLNLMKQEIDVLMDKNKQMKDVLCRLELQEKVCTFVVVEGIKDFHDQTQILLE